MDMGDGMRKTNRNIKRLNMLKVLLTFVLIQCVLLVLLWLTFDGWRYATEETTETKIFIAKNVEYYGIPRHRKIVITDQNNVDYNVILRLLKVDRQELLEDFSEKEFTIRYNTSHGIYGEFYTVCDIRSEDIVYYSMDDYNSERASQVTCGVTMISILELAWLLSLSMYLLYVYRGGLFRSTKRKKAKKYTQNIF